MAILKKWTRQKSGIKGRLLLFNTVNYSFFGGGYNHVHGKSLC